MTAGRRGLRTRHARRGLRLVIVGQRKAGMPRLGGWHTRPAGRPRRQGGRTCQRVMPAMSCCGIAGRDETP